MKYLIVVMICGTIAVGCSSRNPLSDLSEEELQKRCQTAMRSEDYTAARPFVDEMVRRKPDDFDALAARGIVLTFAGQC